ncbi:MAG: T9SS type A sorting domain-containing protein [Bacteroidota bacterium]
MKRIQQIMLVLAWLVYSPIVSAQETWIQNYEDDHSQFISGMAQTLDGGYIMASGSTVFDLYFLRKVDALGQEMWRDTFENVFPLHLKPALDGGFFLRGYLIEENLAKVMLQKYDASSNLLWSQTYQEQDTSVFNQFFYDFTELHDGSLLAIIGGDGISTSNGHYLMKTTSTGDLLWEKNLGFNPWASGYKEIFTEADGNALIIVNGSFEEAMKVNPDGNVLWYTDLVNGSNGPITGGALNSYAPHPVEGGVVAGTNNIGFLKRLDGDGNVLWEHPNIGGNENYQPRTILRSIDNHYVSMGVITTTGSQAIALKKVDENNNTIWTRRIEIGQQISDGTMISTNDGGFLISCHVNTAGTWQSILVKTNSLGSAYGQLIEGQILIDENDDCLNDVDEFPLEQYLILADGTTDYYGTLQSDARYNIDLDTGDYTLNVFPYSNYWSICNNGTSVSITEADTITIQDFTAQSVVDCPYLEVDVSVPRLRPCMSNRVYVNYSNFGGTIDAEDAYVELSFEPYFRIDSASIDIVSQVNNLVTFDLGNIPLGTQDGFVVYTSFNCDSLEVLTGLTPCIEAHIYPDSLCLENTTAWSGASIEVGAECLGDSVRFTITNVGLGNMANALEYIVVEDEVILSIGNFQLGQGASQEVMVEATGATFRLEAEQEPFHPGNSMPSVSVEACGSSAAGGLSLGYINVFNQNDNDPFVDIDCRTITNSYDPNDKQGFPLGYGTGNFIRENTDLEYLIRFQNTGTDTAFKVVIVDPISPHLDLSTIRIGAASHPYTWSISNGRSLRFEFDNILLPDSTTNLEGSNGFISFKIAQQTDLPIGTQIHNYAGIYFDFNAPILTNTTLNTVGEDLISDVDDPEQSPLDKVKVFPNPFQASTTFTIEAEATQNLTFSLIDLHGRLIRRHTFSGTNYELHKNDLPPGMYFYSIENTSGLLGSGKLVVE